MGGFPGSRPENCPARNSQFAIRNSRAFTLIELLVVITILGILAGLSVPALKNLGKSNVQAGATRQLLDDIARARLMAISQRTTVYMVFVPTNFWGSLSGTNFNNLAMTNAIPLQLAGYNYVAYGRVGDQPGQHSWRYLADWQTLPEGTFIAAAKFQPRNLSPVLSVPQWQQDYGNQIDQNWYFGRQQLYGFATFAVPFPTEDSPPVPMPCLAFDYLGRLVSEADAGGNYHHAYIPLAQGTVAYGHNTDKQPVPTTVTAGDITENPPGNSTGIGYNIIDVNPQTGRASLQKFKMP